MFKKKFRKVSMFSSIGFHRGFCGFQWGLIGFHFLAGCRYPAKGLTFGGLVENPF